MSLDEVNTQATHNAKGNREHQRIMQLHESVFANTGHAWNRPPPHEAQWQASDRRERDAIVAALETSGVWGFKDPRTLFTLSGWLECLPEARLVATLRHPGRVAASLAARGGALHVAPSRGLELWRHYNRRLLSLWHDYRFPIIDFDAEPATYQRSVNAVCARLGLEGQSDFFDTSLRRSAAEGIDIDDECTELYESLRDACLASEGLSS